MNSRKVSAVCIKCSQRVVFANEARALESGWYFVPGQGWICTSCNPESGTQMEFPLPFSLRQISDDDSKEFRHYLDDRNFDV